MPDLHAQLVHEAQWERALGWHHGTAENSWSNFHRPPNAEVTLMAKGALERALAKPRP